MTVSFPANTNTVLPIVTEYKGINEANKVRKLQRINAYLLMTSLAKLCVRLAVVALAAKLVSFLLSIIPEICERR